MSEATEMCADSSRELMDVSIKEVAEMPEKRMLMKLGGVILAVLLFVTGSDADMAGINEPPERNKKKIESMEGREAAGSETESYSQELLVLSALVSAEVGDLSSECQIATASVVMNRVNSETFPNTVYDVIYQPGQYETVENGRIENQPEEGVRKNVELVLKNGSQIPDNVVYQGMFPQGSGIWDVIDGEYFCYE